MCLLISIKKEKGRSYDKRRTHRRLVTCSSQPLSWDGATHERIKGVVIVDINPFNPLYLKGFHDGKRAAVEEFARRFEKLQRTKGIGPKTIQKMVEVMELPLKEQ